MIPSDSVPPSAEELKGKYWAVKGTVLTSEARGDKDCGKARESADKRRAWDTPILESNVVVIRVDSSIDENADENEDDDSKDLEAREPIFWRMDEEERVNEEQRRT